MKTMHCIDRVSPFSGNTNSMFMLLDVADYDKWRSGGGCIQDIIPYLSADEPKSDNGLSAEQIVEKALDLCDKHSITREQFMLALRDKLAPSQPQANLKLAS